MKKLILFVCFFFLFGCTVGEFPENRNRLHERGRNESFCQQHPKHCVDGVQW